MASNLSTSRPIVGVSDLGAGTNTARSRRSVGIWLLVCAAAVFLMVVLGGATRLTGSGLSIVEWQLVRGVLPPLSESAWRELFTKYQSSPEWRLVNAGMDLAGFKSIFWLEYLHRLLGRSIGFVVLVPFAYFLKRRALSGRTLRLVVVAFLLGALQGLVGWYMVKSGLVAEPRVSHYRLALHLLMALGIYGMLVWAALDQLFDRGDPFGARELGLQRFARWVTLAVFVTVGAGALVAGLHAGHVSSTFPLMHGRLVPRGLLALEPVWRNLFENALTVQFQHRVLATLVLVGVGALWLRGRGLELGRGRRLALHLSLAATLAQYALGAMTVILFVPKVLAGLHQALACVLFTTLLVVAHRPPIRAEY